MVFDGDDDDDDDDDYDKWWWLLLLVVTYCFVGIDTSTQILVDYHDDDAIELVDGTPKFCP